jgi:hypothetical protein
MSRIVALCVLLVVGFSGIGQEHHESATQSRLSWDWHHAQELSWKQSISRTTNLTTPERDRLLTAIVKQLRQSDFESAEEMRRVAAETRIQYVDLDSDGKPDVIAQAGGDNPGCSPTGNCTFWILHSHDGRYETLLEAEAQTFTVQPTRSKKFFTVVLTRHSSAFESEVKVYKFDGEAYREDGCYTAEWEALGDDGEYHRLKEPRITSCKAQSSGSE